MRTVVRDLSIAPSGEPAPAWATDAVDVLVAAALLCAVALAVLL